MRSWLFAVGVLVLAFPSVAHPQTSRNRLRDLGSVGVSVLSLDVNARNAGLSEENLKTAIELRLRQSGIRVAGPRNDVVLSIGITVLDATTRGHAFMVILQLTEWVHLQRHAADLLRADIETLLRDLLVDSTVRASTWQTASLETTERDDARTFIRDAVLEKVDEFANDYLAGEPSIAGFQPAQTANESLRPGVVFPPPTVR